MAWTYIKTNFRCEKKYWDNFSIFLGKITNWWEHNFSKVINTSSIQLMVLYLIKIVSNHRWAKIKEKIHFFGKKTRETDSHLCTALVKLSVSYLLHFFYWFLAYCANPPYIFSNYQYLQKNLLKKHESISRVFLKKSRPKAHFNHMKICVHRSIKSIGVGWCLGHL